MKKMIPLIVIGLCLMLSMGLAQTNEWSAEYVTEDTEFNGTGDQTPSVGVVAPNRFVALVTLTPDSPIYENLFTVPGNYLVGYWDADSSLGRVPSPIAVGENPWQLTVPAYSTDDQWTVWAESLDEQRLNAAYQLAADDSGYIYVANNDESHNILVFRLTESGVISTPYRMETGTENIFAIDVDTAGYVYVVDYQGNDQKTDEVKVFAGINAPNTTWEGFGGHTDSPVTTIDLPTDRYIGVAVSNDGSAVFVSAFAQRSIYKYIGDPESGYVLDTDFQYTMSEGDTLGVPGADPGTDTLVIGGPPTVLGLAYLEEPELVFAAVDTFLGQGTFGGYTYGRIYALDAKWGGVLDTIDIAAWNFNTSGSYGTTGRTGRDGSFTSVVDVDIDPTEKAVYAQTYYGWAVEKWVFDGELGDIVGAVEKIANQLPQDFNLRQNYPNPFNPTTSIEFEITTSEFVTLEIFNALGQKVALLLRGDLNPGVYSVDFTGNNLPSGIYFYQLTAGNQKAVKKMVLTK